jgi:signal transduction histidine kinase
MLRKTRSMLQLIDTTIQSVQRIASQLRPALLDDFGLEAAIEWQVQEWKERMGVRCDYVSSLGDVALSPQQSTAVFRILQEALTNISRHAAASRISILLEENAGYLILEVQDDGGGIKERRTSVANVKSLGVLGMQERARLVGGEATINSIHGKGTTVTVRIPLSPEQIAQGLHQEEAGQGV